MKMQDSLKDYIKISSNTKISPELNKEEIARVLATADSKKKSEEYAQKVVEFLIDGKLKPQIFTRSLNFINISLYQDVVEERAITKLCGYPLCGKQIPEMPEKKYVILAKVNKIYDITDRKNFCCNFCYKASCHIKNQIDDSPLWLRQHDKPQEFALLEKTHTGLTPGEEVLHTSISSTSEQLFTSVSACTEALLHEAEEMERINDKFDEEDIHIESNVIDKPSKSILKNEKLGTTSNTNAKSDSKKVSFEEEDVKPSTSKNCKKSFNKQQEELNECIQNLCKSLNINLSDKDSKIKDNNEKPNIEKVGNSITTNIARTSHVENLEEIKIDINKMNKVIEKVSESEKQRNKPAILIETATNPEISKFVEPPKYSLKLMEFLNKSTFSKSDEKVESSIKKVREISKKKSINKEEDERMQKIIEKLKNKNKEQKKPPILINTIQNPEEIQAKLKEISKNQQLDSTALKTSDVTIVKECFNKWLTIESFLFLYGESRLKQVLSEEKFDDYFNKTKVSQMESSQLEKYSDICRKLNMKEILDEKLDMAITYEQSQKLQPLPNFEQLQDEVKDITLKVKAFYTGEIVVKDKKSVFNKKNSDKNLEKKEEDESGDSEVVLPLVDVSHIALRRSIFNKSITKFIQKHVLELYLEENTLPQLFELIKTFKFDANNIVFKPKQWDLIALILLYCLRKHIDELSTSEVVTYLTKNIENLTNSKTFITDISSTIDNVDEFLKIYIERNDV